MKDLKEFAIEVLQLVQAGKSAVDPDGPKGKRVTVGEWWKLSREAIDVAVKSVKDKEEIFDQFISLTDEQTEALVDLIAADLNAGDKGRHAAKLVVEIVQFNVIKTRALVGVLK